MVPGSKTVGPYTFLYILRSQEVTTDPTGNQTPSSWGYDQESGYTAHSQGSGVEQGVEGSPPPEERGGQRVPRETEGPVGPCLWEPPETSHLLNYLLQGRARGQYVEALCPLHLAGSGNLNQQDISCFCTTTLLTLLAPPADHCLLGQFLTLYLSPVLSQTLETPPWPGDRQGN